MAGGQLNVQSSFGWWLVECLVVGGRSVGQSVGWLVHVRSVVSQLVGWLGLVGRLVGWPVGWSVKGRWLVE